VKRALVLVSLALGVTTAFAVPANAASLCLNGSITVNGTTTPISQCLPPA
jgi:hypothetical protein